MSDKERFDDTDFREVVLQEEAEGEKDRDGSGPEGFGSGQETGQDAKREENEYEDICYICHRPESKAGAMIKISNGICICPACMQKTFASMNHIGFPLGDVGSFGNMPNISTINLPDLQNMDMLPKSLKLKKKTATEE